MALRVRKKPTTMALIPFQLTDWQNVPVSKHPGETGMAFWRSLQLGDLRVRMVEVSAGYLAGEWCQKGHVLFVLEGELETRFPDRETVILKAGMSYEVSDGLSSHKSYSRDGARLFVVDGGFLEPVIDQK
jgi:hypothetical protein